MKNPPQRLNHLLLAAVVALPLFAATGAAHSAEITADQDPAMQQGQHGGPDDPGPRGPMRPPPDRGPMESLRDSGPMGAPSGLRPMGARSGFGPMGPAPDFGHGTPLLRSVDLTDAQEDQVFAILHAEKPYLREQARAAAKAHAALRTLADTDQYDDAKAVALAQAEATAGANMTLQHLRTRQKLLAVLTPEQRAQQKKEMQEMQQMKEAQQMKETQHLQPGDQRAEDRSRRSRP